ncbi:MAG: hypothetical protein JW841_16690 [Deltaproteobacteria bacterium]|nr:hypothetical protein [Deltaproteobacteria bacterium]
MSSFLYLLQKTIEKVTNANSVDGPKIGNGKEIINGRKQKVNEVRELLEAFRVSLIKAGAQELANKYFSPKLFKWNFKSRYLALSDKTIEAKLSSEINKISSSETRKKIADACNYLIEKAFPNGCPLIFNVYSGDHIASSDVTIKTKYNAAFLYSWVTRLYVVSIESSNNFMMGEDIRMNLQTRNHFSQEAVAPLKKLPGAFK